ncbi:pentapeptide repeat-containing protein [Nocardia sp. IFM 10818]
MVWPGWASLTAIVTTFAAVGALWFTGQTLRASNDQAKAALEQVKAARDQLEVAQDVAMTDRFQKAAELLDKEDENTQMAGIFLLERLAKDSPDKDPEIYLVLASFVRTHAPIQQCAPVPDDRQPPLTPPHIQAALTALRRQPVHDDETRFVDLRDTCLVNAELEDASLVGAVFSGADLTDAWIPNANLTRAWLSGTNLTVAYLQSTNLTSAWAMGANFSWALLEDVNFSHALLQGANFTVAACARANFAGAVLSGAILTDAILEDANLTDAYLDDVNLTGADLTGANLTNIYYNEATVWPEGFTPPPSRPER